MSKFGYFENQKEFVFTTPETPRPMLNYLWNDRLLSGVNQTGGGDGSYGGRTMTYVDPEDKGRCSVIRDGNRYFYIQDAENGDFFNPGWYPVKAPVENYKCVHGLGYSWITSERGGLKAGARGFVDQHHPCEIWTVTVENQSERTRKVRVFSFAEFQLEGYQRYSDYFSYVSGSYDPENYFIFCRNDAMEKPHDFYHGFMAASRRPDGFDTSREAFLGTYGEIREPFAVKNGGCTGSLAACEKMVAVLQHDLILQPGESVSYDVLIGAADCPDTARVICKELFAAGAVEEAFAQLQQRKNRLADSILVETPDEKVSRFANYWLKQQVQLCAEIGRDGCKGFRDQLQDAWAVAAFHPQLARNKILETLRYEYRNGRCERGWLPVTNHIYSDGPVWIPLAIAGYIKETGDCSILEEQVPYYDEGSGTVLEHMLIAIRTCSDDVGEHGLVHALEGDWNDSLNMIGLEGRGESVWTSIALKLALDELAEMCREVLGNHALEQEMTERAQRIAQAVNETAWDGGWYLAAYNDQGDKVGSRQEKEGQIYLNSQTWAILAGIARGEREKACHHAMETLLDSAYGPLTLYPTYTAFNPNIGRLTSFVPGIWENGTPYCHGGTFKIVADCYSGRGNEAYRTMMKILPDSAQNPADHSGCEPYAVTNMYFGPDNPRRGKTLFGWVTGTAGWMFRAITQSILGFQPGYNTVTINPCIPSDWKQCRIDRHFRGTLYHVEIENPEGKESGVRELWLDGVRQDENKISIVPDRSECWIRVVL